jgi:tRNA(Ile)-lysidine synthase
MDAIQRLIEPNTKVVVAVSGGIDSMALFHALLTLRASMHLTLIVAHANHGLRGAESDAEAALVQQVAKQHGIPCEIGRLAVSEQLKEENGNLQNVARTQRYTFLEEVAKKWDANTVVLAHHADDQAETVLLRLIRGVGLKGIAGMAEERSLGTTRLLRPLLGIRKSELAAYCAANEVAYLEDSSNQSDKYQRNAWRQLVSPLLDRFNPKWVDAVNRYADVARAEEAWMDGLTKQMLVTHFEFMDGRYVVDRGVFMQFPLALQRRLITLILSYLAEKSEAIRFDKVETIRLSIQQPEPPQLQLHLSQYLRFIREYEVIQFTPLVEEKSVESFDYQVEQWPTTICLPDGARLIFQTEEVVTTEGFMICVDLGTLQFPLRIRNRIPGDRILLPGMTGRKSLKKLFIEESIPQSVRNQLPIVCDGLDRPLWIPGMRPSAHVRDGEGVEKSLHIHYVPYIK